MIMIIIIIIIIIIITIIISKNILKETLTQEPDVSVSSSRHYHMQIIKVLS